MAFDREEWTMNSLVFDIGLAVVLVLAAGCLVYWYLSFKAAQSERRMTSMLQRAGLDPELVKLEDAEVLMSQIRSRCRKCQAEDVCERWLAGKLKGSNAFCPNAGVFEELVKRVQAA